MSGKVPTSSEGSSTAALNGNLPMVTMNLCATTVVSMSGKVSLSSEGASALTQSGSFARGCGHSGSLDL